MLEQVYIVIVEGWGDYSDQEHPIRYVADTVFHSEADAQRFCQEEVKARYGQGFSG